MLSDITAASERAVRSIAPPAAYGATRWIALAGKVCACATSGSASAANSKRFMVILLSGC